jgi:hypothetical protein
MEPAEDNQEQNPQNTNEPIRVQAIRNVPEKDLVVWTAAARPFRRRDKQFYVTTISIASLVCLILFIAEGAMPVILIISLIFLYYIMATVEPEKIEYKITNKGIKIAGKVTPWELMGRFWFSQRSGSELLNLEIFVLPGRMELVIDPLKKEEIRRTLHEYLTEEEIPPTRMDKAIDWFSRKLPQ